VRTAETIDVFGSVANVAAALEISPQAVYQWGDSVPPLRAYQIREQRPGFDTEVAAIRNRCPAEEAQKAA